MVVPSWIYAFLNHFSLMFV